MAIETIRWEGDHVRMIDQTRLPAKKVEIEIRTVPEMVEAIRSLRIRGAPAIGIGAAMGLVAALGPYRDAGPGDFHERLETLASELEAQVLPDGGHGGRRLVEIADVDRCPQDANVAAARHLDVHQAVA